MPNFVRVDSWNNWRRVNFYRTGAKMINLEKKLSEDMSETIRLQTKEAIKVLYETIAFLWLEGLLAESSAAEIFPFFDEILEGFHPWENGDYTPACRAWVKIHLTPKGMTYADYLRHLGEYQIPEDNFRRITSRVKPHGVLMKCLPGNIGLMHLHTVGLFI